MTVSCIWSRVLSPHYPDVLVGADLRVRPEEGNHAGLPLQRNCPGPMRRHPLHLLQGRRCLTLFLHSTNPGNGDTFMRIALLATVVILAGMTYEMAYSETAIMTQELTEFAAKNNCTQLSDFFDRRPGPVNPPYVYGYLPGDEESSAVFWCKNTKPSKHP